ncbi:MAG: hypothetical protein E7653_01415 [Ruminococcaceae bacterium]|nr:hypothetical protein [Oscillospiraceae bacterium]
MSQKNLNLILTIAAIFFAVLAVVLLIVGFVYDAEHLFTKIMIIVVAILSLGLAGELAYMLYISGSVTPNYFLYDPKAKRNVSVQSLNAQMVNARMNRYFSKYAASEGKLWTDGILDDVNLDMADEFKPIVAYKLLIDLAQMDQESGWKCFELASPATVGFICVALKMNGEEEIANNLNMMKAVQPFQVKYVRDYLISNKAYLQSKMMRYVRDNIEKFQ